MVWLKTDSELTVTLQRTRLIELFLPFHLVSKKKIHLRMARGSIGLLNVAQCHLALICTSDTHGIVRGFG